MNIEPVSTNNPFSYNLIIISHTEEMTPLLVAKPWERMQTEFNFIELYRFQGWLLLKTGIGLVNSAVSLSTILKIYHINTIIGIGSAGVIFDPHTKIPPMDVFLVDKATELDANLTKFNYELGSLPRLQQHCIKTNVALNRKISDIIKHNNTADIASSNRFINYLEDLPAPVDDFAVKFSLIDMESASWVIAANYFKNKIAIIKIVSDIITTKKYKTSNYTFEHNIGNVAQKISDVITQLMECWD